MKSPPANGHGPSPSLHGRDQPSRRVGLLELFLLFSQLGLSSFGGAVSAWVHRGFVVRRGLIGDAEFAAALGLARIMPGANVVNLAVILGQRLRGAAGAVTAALGLIVGPSLAVVALAILYRRFAGSIGLRAVLEGAAAASVGLMIAMGLAAGAYVVGIGTKSPLWTLRNAAGAAVMAATFILVGVLRFPMVPTVLLLMPLSIAAAYFSPPPRAPDPSHAGG